MYTSIRRILEKQKLAMKKLNFPVDLIKITPCTGIEKLAIVLPSYSRVQACVSPGCFSFGRRSPATAVSPPLTKLIWEPWYVFVTLQSIYGQLLLVPGISTKKIARLPIFYVHSGPFQIYPHS